jgi:hypothetical protein
MFKSDETDYSKNTRKLNTFQHYGSVVVLNNLEMATGNQYSRVVLLGIKS